jgi:hypothetical protein
VTLVDTSVDTSVWIELLAGRVRAEPKEMLRACTCGPVMQEVLQGLRAALESEGFREAFLALPRLSDPLPISTFLAASDIFRFGRRKGYTIRSSVDCLIAAIAIENNVPVWRRDRGFDAIASYTTLQIR